MTREIARHYFLVKCILDYCKDSIDLEVTDKILK